jgi:hypothetical protein
MGMDEEEFHSAPTQARGREEGRPVIGENLLATIVPIAYTFFFHTNRLR